MKQSTSPIYIENNKAQKLKIMPVGKMEFSEDFIQDLCFNNTSLLPVEEIEPIYNGLIPLCRELSMPSGFCDVVYINESGLITLVECKLWKNPEARRKVIGQIIDYAKDLASWDYETFERNVLICRKGSEKSLIEIIHNYSPDVDESTFIDNVYKNIKKGRFLLLIVGDGIRENTEEMVRFMNDYSKLSFTISLVELPIYKIENTESLIVAPRILVKTVEIVRNVLSIEDKNNGNITDKKEIVTTPSESVFYERLENNIGKETVDNLKAFISELKARYGIITKLGRGKTLSLNLKTEDDIFNFAGIIENGDVQFYGVLYEAEKIGDKSIGDKYLTDLAIALKGEYFKGYAEWSWCVKRNGNYIKISEYLKSKEQWLKIIDEFMAAKIKIEES
ncbi:MAG: hypothetical protein J5798_04055 [Spirochaetaceae bacterium]|nr:hypothetical protein [Spirochaetaceae bacterium]